MGNPSDGLSPYHTVGSGTDHYPFRYPYGWEMGAMDDNGVVDLADALIALQVIADRAEKPTPRTEYAGSHADVDGNSVLGGIPSLSTFFRRLRG